MGQAPFLNQKHAEPRAALTGALLPEMNKEKL